MDMLDAMDRQVENATDGDARKPLAKMVRSVQELVDLLGQDADRRVAVIHNVEGAHTLDGDLGNLQRLFDRGVAYLTLAQRLIAEGYSQDPISRIWGGNALRVLRDGWGRIC